MTSNTETQFSMKRRNTGNANLISTETFENEYCFLHGICSAALKTKDGVFQNVIK